MHIYWIGNERILSYKPSTGMKNNWEVASNAQNSQKRQKMAILQMFFGLVWFASIFVPSRNYRIWSPWSEKNSLVWYNHCHFSSFSTKVDRTFKNTGKITIYVCKKKITLYIGKLTQLSGYSYIYIQLFILHTIVLYTIHISV